MFYRFFLLIAIGLGLWWTLRRSLRAAAPRSPRQTRPTPPQGEGMVRDRVCNTFIPRSRALRLTQGQEDLFFCSERCRGEYQRGHAEPPQAVG